MIDRNRLTAVENMIIRVRGLRQGTDATRREARMFCEMLQAALSIPFRMAEACAQCGKYPCECDEEINIPSPEQSRELAAPEAASSTSDQYQRDKKD